MSEKPSLPDNEIGVRAQRYLEWLRVRNYSPSTIRYELVYLRRFLEWLGDRGIHRLSEVTRGLLERYRVHVSGITKADGKRLNVKTQYLYLITLRGFFRYLSRNNYILYNPAAELELPRLSQPLPRYVLSSSEVENILRQPNIKTLIGLRDRAILEVFYATGIRRKELACLKLRDVDFGRGVLLIREGKFKKDRVVPLGERAQAWLEKYIADSRVQLIRYPDERNEGAEGYVFLSHNGEGIGNAYLSELVGRYIAASGVDKPGACHLFRHSMATLMLEGGADIRYIQEMLGHARLETTQIYTRVAISKLKEVHSRTHPGANLKASRDHRGGEAPEVLEEPGEMLEGVER